MELIYDYWSGHITNISFNLRQSINSYIRHYSTVKIGITCNPERRMSEHDRSGIGWEKMIVKYKTSSVSYINEIEKETIDSHWDDITNMVSGGGGPNGNPPYFLYILLKNKALQPFPSKFPYQC